MRPEGGVNAVVGVGGECCVTGWAMFGAGSQLMPASHYRDNCSRVPAYHRKCRVMLLPELEQPWGA